MLKFCGQSSKTTKLWAKSLKIMGGWSLRLNCTLFHRNDSRFFFTLLEVL